MKYCVIKNTTKIVDGSENPQEIMLKNAENAGFLDTEVEILTEQEFETRKALEPIPPQEPTLEEKVIEQQKIIDDLIQVLVDKGVVY